MVAEEVDPRNVCIDPDVSRPDATLRVMNHLGGVLIGNQLAKIIRAAIGSTIVHPKDAAAVFARVRRKPNGDLQSTGCYFVFDNRSRQQWLDILSKEMSQQKRVSVALITFELRMPFLAMPCVGSKINRNVWMMRSAPGKIVGHHVMCSGMKQHLHTAPLECWQIARDKNAVGNVRCKLLQLFPCVTFIKRRLIKVGTEMATGKTSLLPTSRLMQFPGGSIAQPQRRIPNRLHRCMHCRHAFVMQNRH